MNQDPSVPYPSSPQAPFPWEEPPGEPAEPEKTALILPGVLFLLTVLTTLGAGYFFHLSFVIRSEEELMRRLTGLLANPMDLFNGLPFCLTVLLILLAHEMGHYLACRYYGIRATLPYVIPAPPIFNPFGTFGAVIKIKSPFQNRAQLFDVGIAGPLAGFVFIVPALIVGISRSRVFEFLGSTEAMFEFGEPLLFRWAAEQFFVAGDAASINLHPVGWAAWLGMLATSLNLLPVGQLDGGHIVYALFGARWHRIISYATFGALVVLGMTFWLGYLLFAVVLVFIGIRHPRPRVEFSSLGRGRLWLALLALIILILTFIPTPVRLVEHAGRL